MKKKRKKATKEGAAADEKRGATGVENGRENEAFRSSLAAFQKRRNVGETR